MYIYIHINYMYIYITNIYIYVLIYCIVQPPIVINHQVRSNLQPTQPEKQRSYTVPVTLPSASSMSSDVGLGAGAAAVNPLIFSRIDTDSAFMMD